MNLALIRKYTLTLESIMETDRQAIRDFRAGKITASEITEINKNNVEIVKKIISEIGFPTISLTSQKAYNAAVLVVLHSGDADFINESINNLHHTDPISIQKSDIAFMTDKARVIQNLPQLYGTQYQIDKNGVIKYVEIEKLEDLEKRRAEYGMESFVEYKKMVEKNRHSNP